MTMQSSSKKNAARKKKALDARLLERLAHASRWRPGERIAVAVSGGADSVALLLLLLEAREKLGIVVSVAHLNHQLRGRASDRDEKFVARLTKDRQLELYVERSDVAAKARHEKANLEDAARRARYDFFSRLVTEKKVERVAVAHTADDQAETVLAHILRGTGLAGLGGIHPETDCVVRPLLCVRRAELRAYLRSKRQKWCEDATNQDTARLRARIRQKLLPLLEKQFQPAAVEHLVSLAEFAREDEALLELLAAQRCAAAAEKTPAGTRIALRDLLGQSGQVVLNTIGTQVTEKSDAARANLALTKRVLQRLIHQSKDERARDASGGPRSAQITAQHIASVLELAQRGESGKVLQLPGSLEVRRERNALLFCKPASPEPSETCKARKRFAESRSVYEHQIWLGDTVPVLCLATPHCALRFAVIDWPENRVETRESGTVLDRDQLAFPLVLRNWRPGDKLHPMGHQKPHKLKRLFNEKRISRWERQGWPVLASGETLVWVRGFPVNAEFAATGATRKAISIAEEP